MSTETSYIVEEGRGGGGGRGEQVPTNSQRFDPQSRPQELCGSPGGRLGLPTVFVDVKQHSTNQPSE